MVTSAQRTDLRTAPFLSPSAQFARTGPGKTASADDFSTAMWTLQQIVFDWPDETEFFPGHGPSGTIGAERGRFNAFVNKGWPSELHGDVTWD